MKVISLIALTLVVTFTLGLSQPFNAFAWGDDCDYSRDDKRDVALSDVGLIKVRAGAGKLRILGEDRDSILIDASLCADSKDQLAQMSVSEMEDGGVVEIKTQFGKDGFFTKKWKTASIDLVLRVPNDIAMDVKDSSGSAALSNLESLIMVDSSGELMISDVSRDVDVTDSSGALTVKNVAGNVRVTDSSGGVEVADISGDFTVEVDSSGAIDANNIGGDVLVKVDSSGAIRVSDVAGNFRVVQDSSGGISYDNVAGKVSLP